MPAPTLRFDRRRRWPAPLIAALLVGAGWLAAFGPRPTGPPPVTASERGPAWGPSPFDARLDPTAAVAAAAAEPNRVAATLAPPASGAAARVDALVARDTPADAYAAYLIVRGCSSARRLESRGLPQAPPSAVTCGDLAPAQLLLEPTLLHRAAAAGVPGAAWSFVFGGPDGTSVDPPRGTADEMADPATAEYFARARVYQEAAARAGDRLALMSLSLQAQNEDRDMARAFAYWAAQEMVARARGGAPSASYEAVARRLGADLTIEQRAAALDLATQLAARGTAVPCSPCDAADGQTVAAAAWIARTREQSASLPPPLPAGVAALPFAGRSTLPSYSPGDVVTTCTGAACEAASYQATGLWLPLPPTRVAAPRTGP